MSFLKGMKLIIEGLKNIFTWQQQQQQTQRVYLGILFLFCLIFDFGDFFPHYFLKCNTARKH